MTRESLGRQSTDPKAPTLAFAVCSDANIGEVRFYGTLHPGAFEPLVDRATFNAVQAKFAKKVHVRPELAFGGRLMTCGHCGHVITGETKRKASSDGSVNEYTYYFCTHYREAGHPRRRLTEAQVEAPFLALFDRMRIEDPAIRQWIVDVIKARANAGQDANKKHRAELDRERASIESKLKVLLDLRMDGEIQADEYAIKRSELQDRLAGVRVQHESTDRDDAQIVDLAVRVFELSQSLKSRWKNATFLEKREILALLCESVLSNSGKLEIRLKNPSIWSPTATLLHPMEPAKRQ
jgi:site-specific DNA recombinase